MQTVSPCPLPVSQYVKVYKIRRNTAILFILNEVFNFGSPFGRYPTFHTLTSVGRKKLSVCQKNVSAFSCYSEVFNSVFLKALNFKHFVTSFFY